MSSYTYYTSIQDLFEDLSLSSSDVSASIADVPKLLDMIDINKQSFSSSTMLLNLFQQYIIPSFYNSVIDIEVYDDEDEVDKSHTSLLAKISTWCTSSLKEYGTIAKLYDDNINNLLSKISSTVTTTSKSSDTPEVYGEWDGDEQLSAINSTTTTNESDNATMINQLDEIRRRFKDIMDEWKNDFYKRFLSEVLIYG